jgi:hypothetical protein
LSRSACGFVKIRLFLPEINFLYNFSYELGGGQARRELASVSLGVQIMNQRLSIVFAILAVLVMNTEADAVEILTAEELASHCIAFPDEVDSADGQYCVRYIQGFIDGAVATDVRVMLNMEAEKDDEETFTERAIRTRMIDRTSERRAAGYAEFCLGDPLPLLEVVKTIVNDLNQRTKSMDSSGTARDAVYESLRRNFPCEAP